MIICKTHDEVELMRKSALLVSRTLTEVAALLKPGVTTISLDKMIGQPFVIIMQFRRSLIIMATYNSCISVNDVVVLFPQ
jgi:methionyl aminopeptidase